jgi:hypothetical protein
VTALPNKSAETNRRRAVLLGSWRRCERASERCQSMIMSCPELMNLKKRTLSLTDTFPIERMRGLGRYCGFGRDDRASHRSP